MVDLVLDLSGDPSLSHPEPDGPDAPASDHLPPHHVPLPSLSTIGAPNPTSSLTPVVCDERVIARLLDLILSRGGLTVVEAASRLGVHPNSIRQYLYGQRTKPSLKWFVRFAELCGARVMIEFPSKGRFS